MSQKNQWTTQWGEAGYVKWARNMGPTSMGLCGITGNIVVPWISGFAPPGSGGGTVGGSAGAGMEMPPEPPSPEFSMDDAPPSPADIPTEIPI